MLINLSIIVRVVLEWWFLIRDLIFCISKKLKVKEKFYKKLRRLDNKGIRKSNNFKVKDIQTIIPNKFI